MILHRNFWSRYAPIYERFVQRYDAIYTELYALIRPCVREKVVLELATGTGTIAREMVNEALRVEATDASPEMIAEAQKTKTSHNLFFSVQDMFQLPYAEESFDVILVANALHIVNEPERALAEAKRVLRKEGVLIAPTFTQGKLGLGAKIQVSLMKLAGFPLCYTWTSESYMEFIEQNGFHIQQSKVLGTSFPLTYVECTKQNEM